MTFKRIRSMMAFTLGAVGIVTLGTGGCTGELGSTFGDEAYRPGSADSDALSNLNLSNDGDGGNSGTNANNDCGDMTFTPSLIGVDMFLAVDRSGSMGGDKWTNSEAAFTSFFKNPAADNLHVALKFWPDQSSCNGSTCTTSGCATPDVALGSLADTAHETALVTAFNNIGPEGRTPMWAALGGAAEWAINNQNTGEVGRSTVVVLLTDGIPNDCSGPGQPGAPAGGQQIVDPIAKHAADALASDGILTFAVGLEGSREADVNAIAAAGGTTKGFFIGSTGNAQQELVDALKDIQKIAVACSYALPESPEITKQVDPQSLAMYYKQTPSAKGTELPHVANESACNQYGGWYYDDNASPSVLHLCEKSCEKVNDVNYPEGSVELTAGCRFVAK